MINHTTYMMLMIFGAIALCLLCNAFLIVACWRAIDRLAEGKRGSEEETPPPYFSEIISSVIWKTMVLATIFSTMGSMLNPKITNMTDKFVVILVAQLFAGILLGVILGLFMAGGAMLGARKGTRAAKALSALGLLAAEAAAAFLCLV